MSVTPQLRRVFSTPFFLNTMLTMYKWIVISSFLRMMTIFAKNPSQKSEMQYKTYFSRRKTGPRVSVCMSVCLSVCVCQLYSPKGKADFDVNPHKYSIGCLLMPLFSDFENFNLMTSWRPFCIKPLGHSHVCIKAPIFFKFAHDVAYIPGLFDIENERDR